VYKLCAKKTVNTTYCWIVSPLRANPLLSSVVISSLRATVCYSNMLQKFLLIITLICMTKCERSFQSYSAENLYAILDQTTEYFKNLSNGKILILIISSFICKNFCFHL